MEQFDQSDEMKFDLLQINKDKKYSLLNEKDSQLLLSSFNPQDLMQQSSNYGLDTGQKKVQQTNNDQCNDDSNLHNEKKNSSHQDEISRAEFRTPIVQNFIGTQEHQRVQQMQDKTKINPAYNKYFIDENNQDFINAKTIFSENDIKEAFDMLDMKKARYITKENVQFFLEMIEEEATEEEIKEMIRLCDGGTEGQVTYENFKNLMTYQSLAPIGQAYPPTFQMMENKQKSEKKLAISQKQQQQQQQQSTMLTQATQDLTNRTPQPVIQSSTVIAASTQNPKFSDHKMALFRKEKLQNFVKFTKMTPDALNSYLNYLKTSAIQQEEEKMIVNSDYQTFLRFFEQNDNEVVKSAFESLLEPEQKQINLTLFLFSLSNYQRNFVLCLISASDINQTEKIYLAFTFLDTTGNGFIYKKDFIRLLQVLSIILLKIIKNFRFELQPSKIVLSQAKQIKDDVITKEFLFKMVNEFRNIFFI